MNPRPLALVTGAARRVGAAIARELAHAGCDLILTRRHSADEAEALARELGASGANAAVLPLDLDDPQRAADELAGQLTRLDVLVHNASLYQPSSHPDARQALALYRVNALAPLLLTLRLAPLLARSTLPAGGAVVALADVHALGRPRLHYAAYSMSKAALVEMVRSLARDLAPHVRVNAVAPGVVAWPESGPDAHPDVQRAYLARVPLARPGTPLDAARAVRFLALEAAYTTGEVLRVDGGRWLA
jgi:pteridine reductase